VPLAPSLSLTPETKTYQEPDSQPASQKRQPAVNIPEIKLPEVYMPEIDWATTTRGLGALIAVLGLIPFWIWIFILYNPR
jgi:hypothetical protein